VRTPASLVDRAGDDLLADAAFPGDEYLCVGARGAENLLLYFAQDPEIRGLWDEELKTDSYYGFTLEDLADA